LAFVQNGHAGILPVRYAFVDDWVYFRADRRLRAVILGNPWLVFAVTELRDASHVTSVIVRGGCYVATDTGTPAGDAAALRGILELRDRPRADAERTPRVRRSAAVFRLHVDGLHGVVALVPCPAGEIPAGTSATR
jgi:hypothetical protein